MHLPPGPRLARVEGCMGRRAVTTGLMSKLPGRLRLADPMLGRNRVLCRHASKDQANIVVAVCLDRRVEKELFQNILLRVTATQTVHVVEDGFHEMDRVGIFTASMRQYRL